MVDTADTAYIADKDTADLAGTADKAAVVFFLGTLQSAKLAQLMKKRQFACFISRGPGR